MLDSNKFPNHRPIYPHEFPRAIKVLRDSKQIPAIGLERWRLARIQNRAILIALIQSVISDASREHLLALFVDSNLDLLKIYEVGSSSASYVDFRLSEIIRVGFAVEATAFFLVHNHPSGVAMPSAEDISVTRKISNISQDLDMPLLDHLVVTRDEIKSIGLW